MLIITFSVALSVGFASVPSIPVRASAFVGATIDDNVVQGKVFLLRYEMVFDSPADLGEFAMTTWWENLSPGGANRVENFTLENWRVYFPATDNDLENVVVEQAPTAKGWKIIVKTETGKGDWRDGTFYIDLWLRAASNGAPHRPAENREVLYIGTVREGADLDFIPQTSLYIDVLQWPGGGFLRAMENGFNADLSGVDPFVWYVSGDYPPIGWATRAGLGAVAAGGFVSACMDGTWNSMGNPDPHLDNLIDALIQWMVPGAEKVVWYEGYGVYYKTSRSSQLITSLTARGYTIAGENRPFAVFLPGNENHILIIPQLRLGDPMEGGDPSLLPESDVEAINTWIENGHGLLIMEGGDGGPNFYRVQNRILNAFNFPWWFQHDQVRDNVRNWDIFDRPILRVENVIGACYLTSTGKTTVGLENSCTLASKPALGVNVLISPGENGALPGQTTTFSITLVNTGDVWDNYTITVSDNLNWPLFVSPQSLFLLPGENGVATLSVTIPDNAEPCTEDNVTVTATSFNDLTVSDSAVCIAHARSPLGVNVSISPSYQSDLPGETLEYVVTVKNVGAGLDNYVLTITDNEGWNPTLSENLLENVQPGENRTVTLSITIPSDAVPCTEDQIIVTATSTSFPTISDNGTCIAHALAAYGVEVFVSPGYQSGVNGETLTYTVTVINTGLMSATYKLSATDSLGWNPSISPSLLFLHPGENGIATLSVTVPENAVGCTEDNLVASASVNGVSDNDTCIAHVTAMRRVGVSILPDYRSGTPGRTLEYEVTVTNEGNIEDNYTLTAIDNTGWGPSILPTSLSLLPGENGLATLSVTIPENAVACTQNNLKVIATSGENIEISGSDTCIAHATGFKALIYPVADLYAFGEFGKGYSRSQLKFDISGILPDMGVVSAKLWLYRLAAEAWDGSITLYRVDNQTWDEAITASEFDAQTLTNGENYWSKFLSPGWDYLDVLDQLMVDRNVGNVYTSFRLSWADDNGSEASTGIDDGRFLMINSESDGISVIFQSSEYNGNDPYLEISYTPLRAVTVFISPRSQSGLPQENLAYTVTILNTGIFDDNYVLTVTDNAGWDLTISPGVVSVASGDWVTVELRVTIPENIAPRVEDNILVIATSLTDNTVSDNDTCIAHRLKAEFKLKNLYEVSLDLDIYFNEGSRIITEFYDYQDVYEGEEIVWSGPTPTHVVLEENIPHPLGYPVEKVTLVLADEYSNTISVVLIFTVTKDDLWNRIVEIQGIWPDATPEEKDQLWAELVDILMQWPTAPP
jgi:uncharacterized membrane protein